MLPTVRPIFPDLTAIEVEFARCLDTGAVTNNGPYVQKFEEALTAYLGVPTIAFSSGQAALMAMLKAQDVEGMEVICPSFTFAGTPAAIRWAGGTPVFADIDPHTLCLDVDNVIPRLRANTGAILGVDPYGISCDRTALENEPGWERKSVLIDSAPSFGSKIDGKPNIGGTAQIFSFHATKPFSTMEGGCLCSHDPNFLERARRIRNFGQEENGNCFVDGFNGKMMEVCALIGLIQLERFGGIPPLRNTRAAQLRVALGEVPGVRCIIAPKNQMPIWMMQPIMIDAEEFGMSRDDVVKALHRREIMVRKYYSPPCHLMEAYRTDLQLPVTERAAREVIALPIYNDMKQSEVQQIADAIAEIQKEGR